MVNSSTRPECAAQPPLSFIETRQSSELFLRAKLTIIIILASYMLKLQEALKSIFPFTHPSSAIFLPSIH
jgi:hypothetical protein